MIFSRVAGDASSKRNPERASQATPLNDKRNAMSLWFQHLLVLTLVSACVVYALWGAFSTLLGKRSRIGSCCAKGCQTTAPQDVKRQQVERVVFLPAELLRKSGK